MNPPSQYLERKASYRIHQSLSLTKNLNENADVDDDDCKCYRKKTQKNGEEIRVPEFGGWEKKKDFD